MWGTYCAHTLLYGVQQSGSSVSSSHFFLFFFSLSRIGILFLYKKKNRFSSFLQVSELISPPNTKIRFRNVFVRLDDTHARENGHPNHPARVGYILSWSPPPPPKEDDRPVPVQRHGSYSPSHAPDDTRKLIRTAFGGVVDPVVVPSLPLLSGTRTVRKCVGNRNRGAFWRALPMSIVPCFTFVERKIATRGLQLYR